MIVYFHPRSYGNVGQFPSCFDDYFDFSDSLGFPESYLNENVKINVKYNIAKD